LRSEQDLIAVSHVVNGGPVSLTNSRHDRGQLSGDGGGCIQVLNDLLG
jgi:hypothetical protein